MIDEEQWKRARNRVTRIYKASTCLPACLRLIDSFSEINRTKYRTDLLEYVHESKLEDFVEDGGSTVLVSTIHKAKGRQFDSVYMLLDGYDFSTNEKKRVVYVGLTRAKSLLHIHTNTGFFDQFDLPFVHRVTNSETYPEPAEIMIELGHKDVVLDFFKWKTQIIPKLRSGDPLTLEGEYLVTCEPRPVRAAKLSNACRTKLSELSEKGYAVQRAEVRYTVWWKGKEDEEETLISLPSLFLRRTEAL